jgi:hypothetical protein
MMGSRSPGVRLDKANAELRMVVNLSILIELGTDWWGSWAFLQSGDYSLLSKLTIHQKLGKIISLPKSDQLQNNSNGDEAAGNYLRLKLFTRNHKSIILKQ